MSTLWIFSVPFTWLLLPTVMIGHYLFGAYLLLFFTLINILDKWNKCLMLLREGAVCNSLPEDRAFRFMWLNPPSLLSISYILFCVWAGFSYSIYQLPNPILSYPTFCGILIVLEICYSCFSLIRLEHGERNMVVLLYDTFLSGVIAFPAYYLLKRMLENSRVFSDIAGWLRIIVLILSILLIFLAKEVLVNKRGSWQQKLLIVKKLSFIPVYYVSEDIYKYQVIYNKKYAARKEEYFQNLPCRKKQYIIAKEMVREVNSLPKGIYITETHQVLIDYICRKGNQNNFRYCYWLFPAASVKVNYSFQKVYGNNWKRTDDCRRCRQFADYRECQLRNVKRKAYIVGFQKY